MSTITKMSLALAATLSLTIGMAEARKGRPEPVAFEAIDLDGDGQITAQEMSEYRSTRAADRIARLFERADANEDGLLSAEEIQAVSPKGKKGKMRGFGRMDADADGALTKQEFETALAAFAEHSKRGGKRKEHRGE
jgi:Ca2+-binding EF-hand superfamily protein